MIKYNDNNINEWFVNDASIIKVYHNDAICYYKITSSGGTSGQTPCFAVVNDISQYLDTEFEDVFNKADGKWYKLNNLSQYEEYGVYGSGRTSCEGSASRLPQGYTEVEYIENTSTAYINTEVLLYDSTTNSYEIETKMSSTWGGGEFEYLLATEGTSAPYNGLELRWNTHYQSGGELQCESVPKNVTYSNINNGDGTSAITISCTSTNTTNNVPLSLFCGIWSSGPWRNGKGKIYDLKITKNDVLVRDLVPCKRDSDDKYGMYDIVNDVFYISPNNVNLTGGDPITPTECVTTYKGKLTIDDGYEYQYSGGSWVNVGEVSGSTASLPNVDFMLNYNARDYDSSTYSISKTEGQLKDVDAICNYGYHIVDHSSDGYVSVTGNSRMLLSGTTYMGRNNTQTGCTMTVVSKARTTSGYSVFTNRGNAYSSQMNWMWRYPTDAIFLHGSSSYNNPNYFTSTTGTPIVASIRTYYDNGVKQQLNDWTNSGSYSGNFQYGTEYNGSSALFCDYATSNKEFWQGDFYWVYMTQSVLTDEQIQQVIDYNEGNGTVVYPINYDEIQDPPSSVTFSSMTEAESYECPYVGLNADIDSTDYIFDANYDWVTKYGLFEITGEYLCADGNKYKKMEEKVRNVDDTWSSQTPPVYEIGDLIESASTDCQNEFKTIQELLDSGDYQQSTITSREFTLSPRLSGITYFRLYTQSSGSSGSYCFCELYSDTNTGTSMFAIKTDYSGTLYTSVGGYGSIKAAADDENCSWAYWVDEYTMEVDVLDAAGTTLYLKQWQDNFKTSFIGFK